jgi:hypothetical protein
MGAWGTGNFANDTAKDWAADFVEVGDLSFVREVLEKVAATTAEEDLRARVSCHALAACEVIARLKGNWGTRNSYSEKVDDWVQANPTEPSRDLIELALRAIDRIVTAPSELMELWGDVKKGSDWRSTVGDLRERVAR